jgi:hypothetical protein
MLSIGRRMADDDDDDGPVKAFYCRQILFLYILYTLYNV